MSTTVSDSHQAVLLVTQNSQLSILSFIYLYFSDLNIFVVGTYKNALSTKKKQKNNMSDSVTHASYSNRKCAVCKGQTSCNHPQLPVSFGLGLTRALDTHRNTHTHTHLDTFTLSFYLP